MLNPCVGVVNIDNGFGATIQHSQTADKLQTSDVPKGE